MQNTYQDETRKGTGRREFTGSQVSSKCSDINFMAAALEILSDDFGFIELQLTLSKLKSSELYHDKTLTTIYRELMTEFKF